MISILMSRGWTLGHVAGIPVTVNGSWSIAAAVLIVALTFGLGLGVASLPVAVILTLGVYASILAHEFGHALTARQFDVQTQEITLHLFGGVAKLKSEPATPWAEFCVAAAGPVVSLALALGLGIVAVVTTSILDLPTVNLIVGQLAALNLLLGVFNLLPGLPLDGGRILRAWLWARRDNRVSATNSAGRAGEAIAWGLVGLGILGLTGFGPGGLLTILLGLALRRMARHEMNFVRTGSKSPRTRTSFFDDTSRPSTEPTVRFLYDMRTILDQAARARPHSHPDHAPPDASTDTTVTPRRYVVRYVDGNEVVCEER